MPARNIAQWNGTTWAPLGAGTDGNVSALAVIRNTLYVGGSFSNAGNVSVSCVAQWNGTSWADVGGGVFNLTHPGILGVHAMAVSGGTLYVGGAFLTAGGGERH